jgi:hypothetical protein
MAFMKHVGKHGDRSIALYLDKYQVKTICAYSFTQKCYQHTGTIQL